METIICIFIGFAIGRIIGKLKEFSAVEEVENGNRMIINFLNEEIEELREKLKDKAA